MGGFVLVCDADRDVDVESLLSAVGTHGATETSVVTAGPAVLGYVGRPRSSGRGGGLSRTPEVHVALDGRLDNREAVSERVDAPARAGDAAVLARAYRELGPAALEVARGAYSGVVRDRRRDETVLFRDKVGVRHLYYAASGATLVASSDVAGVLAHPAVERRPDEGMVAEHLVGNVATPDETFYEGVRRLPAGHLLRAGAGSREPERYWRPGTVDLPSDPESLARRLRRLVHAAVAERVRDVAAPRVMMSGGLDSTAVAAVAHRQSAAPARTFSVVFGDEAGIDESSGVRAMASRYDVSPTLVRGDRGDLLPGAPSLRRVLRRTPCLDSSIVVNRAVANRAPPGVLLTGVGGNLHDGDRLFLVDHLRRRRVREFLGHVLRSRASSTSLLVTYGLFPLLLDDWTLLNELNDRAVTPPWPDVVDDRFARRVDLSDRLGTDRTADGFERLHRRGIYYQVTDPYVEMALDGLRWYLGSKGIERRHPLLDSRIVDFLCSLPGGTRVGPAEHKVLFRRAMEPVLPDAVLETPTATNTYNSVVSRALRRDLVDRLDGTYRLVERGYVDGPALRELRDACFAGETRRSSLLWRLLTTELWLRTNFDADG